MEFGSSGPVSEFYAMAFGVNTGHNLSLIGKLFGHSKILTTQRYAHLDDDPVRQASEEIGSTLVACLAGGPRAEVLELRSSG